MAVNCGIRAKGVACPKKKEPAPGGASSLLGGCLLRRNDCSDGLNAQGNDLGTDHFARDDQLDAAVLLTPFGCIVRRNGPSLTEARRGGRSSGNALLG